MSPQDRPAARAVAVVTCRPAVADDWNDSGASVAGGGSLFPADGLSVSGSGPSGCPLHPGPRTAAPPLPAGAGVSDGHGKKTNLSGFELLKHEKQNLEGDDEAFALQKVERSRPQSPEDLMGVLEGLRALEALVQAAEESHRQSDYA